MSVVAARVHGTRNFRRIKQACFLLNGKSVHICAEGYGLAGIAFGTGATSDFCSWFAAPQQTHHSPATYALPHLDPQVGQNTGHELCCPRELQADFWVLVDETAPLDYVFLNRSTSFQDIHICTPQELPDSLSHDCVSRLQELLASSRELAFYTLDFLFYYILFLRQTQGAIRAR